jgi:Fur family ferric uptake transcriptional regulator
LLQGVRSKAASGSPAEHSAWPRNQFGRSLPFRSVTVAPESPKLQFEDIHGAVTLLRRRGLRLSAARRQVLETLFALDAPASAEEIAARGGGALGADLASVYRNLEVLEREGIVRHVHLGHGPGLYALAGGREREYLVCERCGRVEAVEPARLDHVRDLIAADLGYVVAFTHFPLVGRCADCARTASAAP